MTSLILENEAWAALERIYDPCSLATRNPLNIVDMGLVRTVAVDDEGNVRVGISPTAPSCMLMASMTEGAERELARIEEVGTIEVKVVTDFFWTPEAMTDRGKEQLARSRAARAGEAPVPLGRLKQKVAT